MVPAPQATAASIVGVLEIKFIMGLRCCRVKNRQVGSACTSTRVSSMGPHPPETTALHDERH